MRANSEGSGETALMRRLHWAFASRLCGKYHNLMSWLIFETKETFFQIKFLDFSMIGEKNCIFQNEIPQSLLEPIQKALCNKHG